MEVHSNYLLFIFIAITGCSHNNQALQQSPPFSLTCAAEKSCSFTAKAEIDFNGRVDRGISLTVLDDGVVLRVSLGSRQEAEWKIGPDGKVEKYNEYSNSNRHFGNSGNKTPVSQLIKKRLKSLYSPESCNKLKVSSQHCTTRVGMLPGMFAHIGSIVWVEQKVHDCGSSFKKFSGGGCENAPAGSNCLPSPGGYHCKRNQEILESALKVSADWMKSLHPKVCVEISLPNLPVQKIAATPRQNFIHLVVVTRKKIKSQILYFKIDAKASGCLIS